MPCSQANPNASSNNNSNNSDNHGQTGSQRSIGSLREIAASNPEVCQRLLEERLWQIEGRSSMDDGRINSTTELRHETRRTETPSLREEEGNSILMHNSRATVATETTRTTTRQQRSVSGRTMHSVASLETIMPRHLDREKMSAMLDVALSMRDDDEGL